MSNAYNALEKYTAARKALDEFQKVTNKAIFDQNEKLVFSVIDAENELRDAVAEDKQSIFNEEFKVTYLPQTMRTYDEEKIRAGLASNPALLAEAIKDVERPGRITIGKQK